MRLRTCSVVAFVLGTSLSLSAQKPAVADVMKIVGDYVTQYAQKISGVGAEEEYTQREPAGNITRRLHSDIAWMGFDGGAIGGYRDVYGLDGHTLRKRDDRLLKMVANPSESTQQEARALEMEGVRHYVSANLRNLDQPLLALDFLRAANQAHSEFELDGVKTQDGVQLATIKWKTKNAAAVLPMPEGLSGTGRAVVDLATGAVRQTEFGVSSKAMMAKVSTKYAHDKTLDLWVPSEVIQQFDISSAAAGLSNMGAGGNMGARISLEGRARYSKFRRQPPS